MTANLDASLQTTIHKRLEELPDWNAVAAVGGIYATVDWLRMFARPQDSYLAIRQGDVILAVAPCVLATEGVLSNFHSSNPQRLFEGGKAPVEIYPVLFCGPTWGFTNRLLIRGGLEPALRKSVVRALLAAVRELGRREGAKLITFGYLPSDEMKELVDLDDTLVAVPTEVDCVIGPITSFDAYLADIKQADRRARGDQAKRDMRGLAETGLRVDCRRLSEVFDAFCELSTRHEQHLGMSTTLEEMREHYQQMVTHLDARTRVFCAWKDDTLLGSALMLSDGEMYYARDFGSDPEVPSRAALYFNLMFYEPVRAAVAEGVKAIHYGRTKIFAKGSRGAHGRLLWFVLDPTTTWDAATRRSLASAARSRLDRDLAELRTFRDEAQIRAQLELDTTEQWIDRI